MKTFTELRRHLTATNAQTKAENPKLFKAHNNPVN